MTAKSKQPKHFWNCFCCGIYLSHARLRDIMTDASTQNVDCLCVFNLGLFEQKFCETQSDVESYTATQNGFLSLLRPFV